MFQSTVEESFWFELFPHNISNFWDIPEENSVWDLERNFLYPSIDKLTCNRI